MTSKRRLTRIVATNRKDSAANPIQNLGIIGQSEGVVLLRSARDTRVVFLPAVCEPLLGVRDIEGLQGKQVMNDAPQNQLLLIVRIAIDRQHTAS